MSRGTEISSLVNFEGSLMNFYCSSLVERKYKRSLYRTVFFLVLTGLLILRQEFNPN
jgi:hypothetical protein